MIRKNIARMMAITFVTCSGVTTHAQTVECAAEVDAQSNLGLASCEVYAEPIVPSQHDRLAHCIPRKKCGPTLYFNAEAMFLSRRYDVASTQFGLGRDFASLDDSGWETGDVGDFEFVDWQLADDFENTSILNDDFGRADQLTGLPRLSFGVVGEHGLGVQGRYWRMENSFGQFGLPVDFSGAGPVDGSPTGDWRDGYLNRVAGFERFSAETIDLELTKDFCFLGWSGLLTLGARHGSYHNHRTNVVDGGIATGAPGLDAPDGSDDDLLDTYHTAAYDLGSRQTAAFRGTGFTTSLTALRPLAFNPDFALFASMRGSVLYGDSVNTAQTYAAMDSFYNSDWDSDSQVIRARNEQYIAELQLGTQWSRDVRFLNGRVFARAAFEYQFWRNNVAQAEAGASAGDLGITRSITVQSGDAGGIGTTSGSSFARGLEQNFDMLGASFSAGFAF